MPSFADQVVSAALDAGIAAIMREIPFETLKDDVKNPAFLILQTQEEPAGYCWMHFLATINNPKFQMDDTIEGPLLHRLEAFAKSANTAAAQVWRQVGGTVSD